MPSLNQFNVGHFCRDLACGIDDLQEVLDDWEVTPERYAELRKNTWFQKELLAAVADIKDLGPNSAFIMKCRAVAEETLGDVYQIIRDARIDPAVRVSAYKQVTELGRLAAPKSEGGGGGGPSVTFNFGPGISGVPETLTISPSEECSTPTESGPTSLPPP